MMCRTDHISVAKRRAPAAKNDKCVRGVILKDFEVRDRWRVEVKL